MKFPNAATRLKRPLKRVRAADGISTWSVYSTPVWLHQHPATGHRKPYVKPENLRKLADRSVTVHHVRYPYSSMVKTRSSR